MAMNYRQTIGAGYPAGWVRTALSRAVAYRHRGVTADPSSRSTFGGW